MQSPDTRRGRTIRALRGSGRGERLVERLLVTRNEYRR